MRTSTRRWVDEEPRTYELIPSEKNYMGEYNMYMSLTNELSVNSLDPERLFHNAWLREGWFRYDKVKWSVDKEVQYDNAALKENVPAYVEIMEYVEQEFVKFVIGARSMEEWTSIRLQLSSWASMPWLLNLPGSITSR